MDKKLLRAGVSALAMTTVLSTLALADDTGAWAEINNLVSTVVDNTAEDNGQIRPNTVDGSLNGTDGVVHVQQNEGSSNAINAAGAVQTQINQSTPTASGAFVHGHSLRNVATQTGGSRTNDVTGSFVDSHGVLTVQQNNGDNNEIGSAEAIQADQNSTGPVSTSAEVSSASENTTAVQEGGIRTNDITNSFRQGTAGVMTVQQNNGDNNAVGAATAVYGANGGYGDVEQSVMAGAGVDTNLPTTSSNFPEPNIRHNTIDPSFDGASGIVTVQQNNGNSNALSAATAVTGNVGGQHDIPGPGNDDQDNVNQLVGVSSNAVGEGTTDDVGTGGLSADSAVLAHDRDNDLVNGSFDGFQGIATVQQNNGDANAIGAGTAVNFNHGLDAPQLQNDVQQYVAVEGEVTRAQTSDVFGESFFNGVGTYAGARNNLVDSVFNDGAAGIANVQQNNGDRNAIGTGNAVQANVDTTAGSLDGDDNVLNQAAQAMGSLAGGNHSAGFDMETDGEGGSLAVPDRDNLINNAFTGYQGLANVQQNNGNGNVMGVANALAAVIDSTDKIDNVGGEGGSLAGTEGNVSDSSSTQLNPDSSQPTGPDRVNTITPSFNGFAGIANVQQNNGNNNVIDSATAVVANIGPVGVGGDDAAGAVTNAAEGVGAVIGNTMTMTTVRANTNEVTASFQGARGIMTVQQNNGANNVMGASTAVAADIDTGTSGFGPALSTASLTGLVTGNTTTITPHFAGTVLLNTINNGAFNGAAGIMTVQQNNGHNNVIQSAIAVSVNLTTVE